MWTQKKRASGIAVALGVAAAAVALGPGTPAQASVPTNAYLISAPSLNNAASPKTVTATCNAGDVALGAAARVVGGGGDVVIVAAIPDALAGTVTVGAVENVAVATNWRVIAYAICGTDPGGINVVTATSGAVAGNGAARADCLPGQQVYGTGFFIDNGLGQVFPAAVRPDPGLTTVTVTGFANAGFAGAFAVNAFAVCGDPAPTMTLQQSSLLPSVVTPKTVSTMACPAGMVQGVGLEITGGPGDVVPDYFVPDASLAGATVIGRANGGFGQNWWNTAYTICAAW